MYVDCAASGGSDTGGDGNGEGYTARTITISFFMALAAIVSMIATMFIISRLCPLWCKSDSSGSSYGSASPTFVSV
jgi:hypothetical protein